MAEFELRALKRFPQAFLNGFCLYACASRSIWSLDKLLLSISIFSHRFFCTFLALGLLFCQNPSQNIPIQLQKKTQSIKQSDTITCLHLKTEVKKWHGGSSCFERPWQWRLTGLVREESCRNGGIQASFHRKD